MSSTLAELVGTGICLGLPMQSVSFLNITNSVHKASEIDRPAHPDIQEYIIMRRGREGGRREGDFMCHVSYIKSVLNGGLIITIL